MVNDDRESTEVANLEKVRNQRRVTNSFKKLLNEAVSGKPEMRGNSSVLQGWYHRDKSDRWHARGAGGGSGQAGSRGSKGESADR